MTDGKRWAAYFHADVHGNRVMRCQGTSRLFTLAEQAQEAGEKDGRPFVVADQHGAVQP